jgi:hypothetical protein
MDDISNESSGPYMPSSRNDELRVARQSKQVTGGSMGGSPLLDFLRNDPYMEGGVMTPEERFRQIENACLGSHFTADALSCDDIRRIGRFLKQVREAREGTFGSVSEMANMLWEAIQPKEGD